MTGLVDRLYRLFYQTAFILLKTSWRYRRASIEGASVLVRDRDQLLVVRHSYQPGLSIPGGGINRGETPLMAARRELREEVGLAAAAEDLTQVATLSYEEHRRQVTLHLFEWRPSPLPHPRIDRREIVWADYRRIDGIMGQDLAKVIETYLAQTSSL